MARTRIANVQKSVVLLRRKSEVTNRLAEAETTRDFLDYLDDHGVEESERTRCIGLLEK